MESVSKKTAKINAFSSIPRDVWRFLLLPKMYMKTIGLLAQTCRAGRRVMEQLRTNNLYLAKLYRKKRQFPLALKCLQSCVDHGDKEAVFHMAFAYLHGHEWGIDNADEPKAFKLFKSISDEPFSLGRVFYAVCLRWGFGCKKNIREGSRIGREILDNERCNPFLRGICIYYGIGANVYFIGSLGAIEKLKKSLKYIDEKNEYALYYLGMCHVYQLNPTKGFCRANVHYKQAKYYYRRAAEHGSEIALRSLVLLDKDCYPEPVEIHNPENKDDAQPVFLLLAIFCFCYGMYVISIMIN